MGQKSNVAQVKKAALVRWMGESVMMDIMGGLSRLGAGELSRVLLQ